MRLLRFLFTARMSFVMFALLAFLMTLLYLAWYHRHEGPVVIQKPRVERVR
jgi:hypothetical protein